MTVAYLMRWYRARHSRWAQSFLIVVLSVWILFVEALQKPNINGLSVCNVSNRKRTRNPPAQGKEPLKYWDAWLPQFQLLCPVRALDHQ